MLKLDKVTKYYRIAGKKRLILDSVNLEIKKGEIVSLTGKSGCGKSTLLNIISGIVKPSHGKVFVNNKPMHFFFDFLSSRMRNRQMGFVFQTFRLLSNESVWANILLPLRIKGWISKKDREYGDQILRSLEISDYKHMKAGLLSGGQKQRVALARALINKPEVILADEPTANLDKATSLEIYKILQTLKEEGKTILVVTHQDYMFDHSDRIYQLQDGKLEVIK